ncbi:MAG TPA: PspC domain-containing protein [Trebonia sp.]|jgi:phage shock protein PspC (stress-responsive transcriptional regulator)
MNTSTVNTDSEPTLPAGRPPLRRAYHGRMLAGVAAGIADYFDVDVTLVRVAFAVFALLGGAGVPAYLACVLLIPEEGTDESLASSLLDSVQHRSR